jgi:hypothetical protein
MPTQQILWPENQAGGLGLGLIAGGGSGGTPPPPPGSFIIAQTGAIFATQSGSELVTA